MKSYWITAGVGALVAVAGAIVYFASNERYGIILILSGLVIAVLGLVMRFVMVYLGDKGDLLK